MSELSIQITTNHELTVQMIDDLMVTALEGGINYWCRKAKITKFPENVEEGQSMTATEVLANGGELTLYDAESDDKWLLTREGFLKGLKMHCEANMSDLMEMYENHDADDADAIVQYAVFNEIVFG